MCWRGLSIIVLLGILVCVPNAAADTHTPNDLRVESTASQWDILVVRLAEKFPKNVKATAPFVTLYYGKAKFGTLTAEDTQTLAYAFSYLKNYREQLNLHCLKKAPASRGIVNLATFLDQFAKAFSASETVPPNVSLIPHETACISFRAQQLIQGKTNPLSEFEDAKAERALHVIGKLAGIRQCRDEPPKFAQLAEEAHDAFANDQKQCHFQKLESENAPEFEKDSAQMYVRDKGGKLTPLSAANTTVSPGMEIIFKGKLGSSNRVKSVETYQSHAAGDLMPKSEKFNSKTGEFESTVQIPKHAKKGDLTIFPVLVTQQGHRHYPNLPFHPKFTVDSPEEDTESPKIEPDSLSLLQRDKNGNLLPLSRPEGKEAFSVPSKFYIQVKAKDDKSGITGADVRFYEQTGSGRRFFQEFSTDFKRFPYDPKTGLLTIEVDMPRHLPKSSWQIEVRVYDARRNNSADYVLIDTPGDDPDETPPHIDFKSLEMRSVAKGKSAALSPQSQNLNLVDPGDEVIWKMKVKDDKAGLKEFVVTLSNLDTPSDRRHVAAKLTPAKEGWSNAEFRFQTLKEMPYGRYRVSEVVIVDNAFNDLRSHRSSASESHEGLEPLLETGFILKGFDQPSALRLPQLATENPPSDTFSHWAKDLSSRDYGTRLRARDRVLAAGQAAVSILQTGLRPGSPDRETLDLETIRRFEEILTELNARSFR